MRLVVYEHYSLICDDVKKEFSAHGLLSLTSEDLANYDKIRFDETSKTVYCYRPVADLSVFIIVMSAPVIFGGVWIYFFTEFMDRPLEKDEKKEDDENEEG